MHKLFAILPLSYYTVPNIFLKALYKKWKLRIGCMWNDFVPQNGRCGVLGFLLWIALSVLPI